MRRIKTAVCLSALLCAIGAWGYGADDNSDQNVHYVLNNGLQVVLDARPGSPLVHVVFAIGIGSRDEKAGQNGLVHLLEHVMLMGGTQSISETEFAARLRASGVYFNAHTDHDLMTLEFTLTPDHLDEVITLAKEKLFSTDFSAETLEREKKAIAEEINQINDDPVQHGRQIIVANLFAGHPYGLPVHGDNEVVCAAEADDLESFYKRFFVPANMSLAVTGGFEPAPLRQIIDNTFAIMDGGVKVNRSLPEVKAMEKNNEALIRMDVEGYHLFFGFLAPTQHDDDRLAFDMVAQIFGRGYNPLLNQALRASGRHLPVSVNPMYMTLDGGGIYLIHIRSDGNHISRIRRDMKRFFIQAARMPFSIDDIPPDQRLGAIDYMQNALTHLKMMYYSFRENGISLASAYARSLLLEKGKSKENYLIRLARLKSKDLNKAIDRFLVSEQVSELIIAPLEEK